MSIYTDLKDYLHKNEKEWLEEHMPNYIDKKPWESFSEWARAIHKFPATKIEALYGVPNPITAEYIRSLMEYGFYPYGGFATGDRKIISGTLKDAYGEVNTVIFSAEGSPPKGRVLINVEVSRTDDAFYNVKELCLISPNFDDILTIEFPGGSEYGTDKEMRIARNLCDSGLFRQLRTESKE
jgi:hypothetical protein